MSCQPAIHVEFVFPVNRFISEFPQFGTLTNDDGVRTFPDTAIARCGRAAMNYITEWRAGFPLDKPEEREYALFLMTAHLLILRKNTEDDMGGGNLPAGGRVRKAVVGAVTVETDSPSSYNADDYTYFLSQTIFGQELLAYLANAAPAGVFLNWPCDSVRVL